MRVPAPALLLCAMTAMTAQVRLPEYSREQLPNGATLILLPKHDVPLISVRAVFRGGAESRAGGPERNLLGHRGADAAGSRKAER